jgi:hypothetical protein
MSFSELVEQPFWLLGVEPTATREQIHAAFELAKRDSRAPEEILTAARDILLDPAQRLTFELAYPLGYPITELAEWLRLASVSVPSDELIRHAAHLSPLNQASFFYYVAANRPADVALLCAITDAYGRVELANVYDQLKQARRLSESPPPSFARLGEAMGVRLDLHCQRIISAYGHIDEAADVISECVREILAAGVPHQINVLKYLLITYRNATADARSSRLADIEAVCDEIERNPEESALTDELAVALDHWIALSRPLLLFENRAHVRDEALKTPLERLGSLIIDLALHAQYERAVEVAGLGKEKLRLIAASAKLLDQAAVPAEQANRTRRARNLARLLSLIDEYRKNPKPLVQALKQNGFGPEGLGAAKQLWHALALVTGETEEGVFAEAWAETRSFAKELQNHPGGVLAARSILQGLLDQGPQLTAPPSAMELLRDDLHQLTNSTAKKASVRKIRLSVAGSLVVLCALLIVVGLEKSWLSVSDVVARVFSQKLAISDEEAGDDETAPAVGAQQHLTLANLRYCEFQGERLRLIKPKVHSAEETRSFNLLVVDYNSRCSDFLYRDGDSLTVQGELARNRPRLAAEAEQILSTWRGRAPQNQPSK